MDSSLPNLSSPSIRGDLLRLESKRRERRATALECFREAYNIIAAAWFATKADLDDVDLSEKIPELVVDAAVEFGWTEYPRRRKLQRTRRFANSSFPYAVMDWVPVTIQDSELVEQVGRFKFEAGFRASVNTRLSGRVAEWQAKISDASAKLPDSAHVAETSVSGRNKRRTSATLGGNINRLRKECGWSFNELARRSGLEKKLILGHVNGGKGVHPNTLKTYADTFTKKLGRTVTVAELES